MLTSESADARCLCQVARLTFTAVPPAACSYVARACDTKKKTIKNTNQLSLHSDVNQQYADWPFAQPAQPLLLQSGRSHAASSRFSACMS